MSTSNRLHLGIENFLQRYTLTSDVAAETAYPLTNMQNQFADTPTVIDMTGETSVTISFSGADELLTNSFCLWNHNLPADATVQLLLYPEEDQGGAPWDSGALPAHNTIPWGAFGPAAPFGATFESTMQLKPSFISYFSDGASSFVAFKSGQIIITAPTFPDDVLRIDKAYLSPSYVFRYNAEHGSIITVVDPSEQQQKPFGGMETIRKQSFRSVDFPFSALEDMEAVNVQVMLNAITRAGDVLISCEPGNLRGMRYFEAMIARAMNDTPLTSRFFNVISTSLKLREN